MGHESKGKSIAADPIRSTEDINKVKLYLADRPRDYAMWIMAVNSNLRISDLKALTVGQFRGLVPGDTFTLKEKKTGKARRITINNAVYEALRPILATSEAMPDDTPLFQSRKGHNAMTTSYLSRLIKSWCEGAGLKGHFSGHTTRKSWAHMQYTKFKVPLSTLMEIMNHSSEKMTLKYLGIQPTEIQNVYRNEL